MRVPQFAVQASSKLKVRRSSLGRGQEDMGGFKMPPVPRVRSPLAGISDGVMVGGLLSSPFWSFSR